MNKIDSELVQAESEVNFWRDFVQWWEAKSGQPVEPRALEALAESEQRYLNAKAESRVDQTTWGIGKVASKEK